jgi:nucleotide-binding universal stress UspA family protein
MSTVSVPTRIALHNIIFATDFLPCADSALPYALGLARRYGSNLCLVNVPPHVPFVEATTPDPVKLRAHAQFKMNELVKSEAFKGITHKELVETGEVPEVLNEVVHRQRGDLIVLGTCGRKGGERFLLGSVAEKVFRTADCPVLTVGPHVTRRMDGELHHIVFATDFGAESVHALPWALSLAEEHNARLSLLHVAREAVVLPEPEPGTLPTEPPAKVVETTTRRLRDLLPASTQLKMPPEYLVKFGTPAETILKAAAEHDVDLLVMGVKRPASVSAAAHLGMHIAYQVACEAPCPVLTVSAFYHG